MPHRLNEDQRLLFDVLSEIWRVWAIRTMIAFLLLSFTGIGITVGIVVSSRKQARQMANVIISLQEQVNLNRETITQQQIQKVIDQQRYDTVLRALETVRRDVKQGKG